MSLELTIDHNSSEGSSEHTPKNFTKHSAVQQDVQNKIVINSPLLESLTVDEVIKTLKDRVEEQGITIEQQREELKRKAEENEALREQNEHLIREKEELIYGSRVKVPKKNKEPEPLSSARWQEIGEVIYYVFDKKNVREYYNFFIDWLADYFRGLNKLVEELTDPPNTTDFVDNPVFPLVLYIVTPGSIRLEHEMDFNRHQCVLNKAKSTIIFILWYGANKDAFPPSELPKNIVSGLNSHYLLFTSHKPCFLSTVVYNNDFGDRHDCEYQLDALFEVKRKRNTILEGEYKRNFEICELM